MIIDFYAPSVLIPHRTKDDLHVKIQSSPA